MPNVWITMKQLIGFLVIAIAISACGSETIRPQGGTTGSVSYGGVWKLQSGTGPLGEVPLEEGWDISIEMAKGRVEGRAACNSYGGRVTISGSSIKVRRFSINQMGCSPAVSRSEQTYVAALLEVDTIARNGETLTLSGPQVELNFREVARPPTEELLAATWHLESLIEGRGPSGTASAAHPAKLRLFEDGTFTGTTGCSGLSGEWIESLDEVLFTTVSSRGKCSEDLLAQDNHVGGVLGDGFTATIEGQELTVFASRGDLGLIYRAGGAQSRSSSDHELLIATAEIVCQRDGSTDLLTPSVDAQADGVHLQVDNRTGEGVSMNGLGWDFSEGTSEAVLSVAPGKVEIACWPYSQHDGQEPSRTPLEVTDSGSYWVPPELECPKGDPVGSVTSDFAGGAPGLEGEPVELVRQEVSGLRPSDILEAAGYPEQEQPAVRIVRDGDVVGVAGLTLTGEGGYLFGSFESCSSAGLRQR
ncbi:MAG: META domain-containing protein [Actinomycetota bacterium]